MRQHVIWVNRTLKCALVAIIVSFLRPFVKHFQFFHFTVSAVPCGSSVPIATHGVHTWFIYILFAWWCKYCSVKIWFSAQKRKKCPCFFLVPSQPPCLYTTLQCVKQDRSIGTEKRVVPTIAMLLQHHGPLGFTGCQAAVTHRAVCLFSLPSSWPYGA